jgi:hypothetical protein
MAPADIRPRAERLDFDNVIAFVMIAFVAWRRDGRQASKRLRAARKQKAEPPSAAASAPELFGAHGADVDNRSARPEELKSTRLPAAINAMRRCS